jgi:hypothetical protein
MRAARAPPPLPPPTHAPAPSFAAPLTTGQDYSWVSNGACRTMGEELWMNCPFNGTGLTVNETFQVREDGTRGRVLPWDDTHVLRARLPGMRWALLLVGVVPSGACLGGSRPAESSRCVRAGTPLPPSGPLQSQHPCLLTVPALHRSSLTQMWPSACPSLLAPA